MGAKVKTVCRKNRTDNNPYCLKRPCYFKASGQCRGPLLIGPGAYSYYNCPDEPDTGGIPKCGTHDECAYCTYARIHGIT